MRIFLAIAICALLVLAAAPAHAEVDFVRDVQPIFQQHCVKCHGADKPRGGLRLDVRDLAMEGSDSGVVIEPGHPDRSDVVRRAASDDPDVMMPPKGERLSDEQVATLRAWIAAGATWPDEAAGTLTVETDHWAFLPVRRPDVPEVKHVGRIRNPIDNFVLARLESRGMTLSPPADRYALIRRVYLDLIGLPPTPEQADAFINDKRSDAYDRVVDELLASPHYGEHWARRWLDLARYADTNGYEKDRERSIWPWRDWVINAYNSDMPFDRFTIEQIAGDMLPDATREQVVATGFHRNTMFNEEGGVDLAEYRFHAMVDRVGTTGTVWLGLTTACTQCHSHKYDPLTQREYYSLMAFMDNADEPEIDVPSDSISARREAISKKIVAAERVMTARFDKVRGHFTKWVAERSAKANRWTPVAPASVEFLKPSTYDVLDDASVLVGGHNPNSNVYTVKLPVGREPITAIRIEVLPHASLPGDGPGRAQFNSGAGPKGDFLLGEVGATIDDRPVEFRGASHSYAQKNRSAAQLLDGKQDTGWSIKPRMGEAHHVVLQLKEPIVGATGSTLTLQLEQRYIHQMCIGRFRVSTTPDAGPVVTSGVPSEVEAALVGAAGDPDRAAADVTLRDYYVLNVAPALKKEREGVAKLRRSMPKQPTTLVLRERAPKNTRVTHMRHRGEYLKRKQAVTPATPAVLHAFPDDLPRNRLGLARWLVDPANPLVGRVAMNRQWLAVFGQGLVRTPEDFGTQGELPTHPLLLDWLADEFVRGGWRMKRMHKLIVMSATYRQSSSVTSDMLARDPENRLLGRAPRYRVPGETVRDIALTASGLLSEKIGGPSVFPPQPASVTALAWGNFKWKASNGPDRYRRGLYTFKKRTAPFAAFMTFDATSGEQCVVKRDRSNTPLQALTTMNDAAFVEAAQALGRRVLELPGGARERATWLMRRCVTRTPSADEVETLVAFYDEQLARFHSGDLKAAPVVGARVPKGVDVNELAAWVVAARVVLNLDETVTRN